MDTILLRFILGGLIVTSFSLISDILQPKSFAGIFGAAPSVALASLGLVFATKSDMEASFNGQAMMIGATALAVYNLVVMRLVWHDRWNTRKAIPIALLVWFTIAFGLWIVILR